MIVLTDTICYRPYVSSRKKCKKTIVIKRVTCGLCINRLVSEGLAEVTVKEIGVKNDD